MKVRSFTVPFAKIAPDATELEFGAGDYLVIRPLFALPFTEQQALVDRIQEMQRLAGEVAELPRADPVRKSAEAKTDSVVLDVIRTACEEWHLEGPDGPIAMPQTPEALDALPTGLAIALYPFLANYRGEANPTTPR